MAGAPVTVAIRFYRGNEPLLVISGRTLEELKEDAEEKGVKNLTRGAFSLSPEVQEGINNLLAALQI